MGFDEPIIYKLFAQFALWFDRLPKLIRKSSFFRSDKIFVNASIALYNNQYYLELRYPQKLFYKASLRYFCNLGKSGCLYLKLAPDFPEVLYFDFNTVNPFRKRTIEVNTKPYLNAYFAALKENIKSPQGSFHLNKKEQLVPNITTVERNFPFASEKEVYIKENIVDVQINLNEEFLFDFNEGILIEDNKKIKFNSKQFLSAKEEKLTININHGISG